MICTAIDIRRRRVHKIPVEERRQFTQSKTVKVRLQKAGSQPFAREPQLEYDTNDWLKMCYTVTHSFSIFYNYFKSLFISVDYITLQLEILTWGRKLLNYASR
ncbi:hypothetical protein LXL04_008546 [Taraxacum kok-saghyz]